MQVDGNESLCSSHDESLHSSVSLSDLPNIESANTSSNLPTVATYNMRSLLPKVNSLKSDILEREIRCCIYTGNLGKHW